MAALNFPASPTNGQVYEANGIVYIYESATTSWVPQAAASNGMDFDGGTASTPTGANFDGGTA